MLKSILVATDFSDRSNKALTRGVQLAKQHHAKLFLAHIIDDDQPKRIINAQTEVATYTLTDIAHDVATTHAIAAESIVKAGTPHITLAKIAKDIAADLLIVGPHRKHFLKDAFVGTTAERTIKYATCPVLLANNAAQAPYSKALFATDFSAGAADAAKTLYTLGLIKPEDVVLYHAFAVAEPIEKTYTQAAQTAEASLKKFASAQGFAAAKPIAEAVEESIPTQIHRTAEAENAGLIIVGARGHTGKTAEFLEQAFFGSVAKEVTSSAKVDVLVTR